MSRRVVITGLGVASPIGLGTDAYWEALRAGRCGLRAFADGPLSHIPPAAGGTLELRMADAKAFYDPRVLRKATMHGSTEAAVVATGDCLTRAGFGADDERKPRYGCYVGSEIAYPDHRKQASGAITLLQRDPDEDAGWRFEDGRLGPAMKALSAFDFLRTLPNMAGSHVSIRGGFQGPVATWLGSSASGLQALIEAYREVRAGAADGMLAAAAWHPFDELYLGYLARRGFSGKPEGLPLEAAMRPFDEARAGFVPAQAGVAFLLEDAERAAARGATVLAEITSAAVRFAVPGRGDPLDARTDTLAAALPPDAPIDAVAVGGASHPELDVLEGQAWSVHLGDRAAAVPWIAASACLGYAGPAAAPLSLAAALLAMRDGVLPPTPNLERPDPACGVFAPRGDEQAAALDGIAAAAFTPEGVHAAVALRRWDEPSA